MDKMISAIKFIQSCRYFCEHMCHLKLTQAMDY